MVSPLPCGCNARLMTSFSYSFTSCSILCPAERGPLGKVPLLEHPWQCSHISSIGTWAYNSPYVIVWEDLLHCCHHLLLRQSIAASCSCILNKSKKVFHYYVMEPEMFGPRPCIAGFIELVLNDLSLVPAMVSH